MEKPNAPGRKTLKQFMRFKPKRRHLVVALCLLPAAAGLYILLLILPTAVYVVPPPAKTQAAPPPLANNDTAVKNQLYIPKIGISVPYLTGGASVLNENAWHRFPERGNPDDGGNFILSGHRFQLGLTPGSTKRRSPFYHINKLETGDKIFVDYEGKRYEYAVVRRFSVKPHQTEIEAPSDTPKLTLYTCTLKGETDGREVIEAKPVPESTDMPI